MPPPSPAGAPPSRSRSESGSRPRLPSLLAAPDATTRRAATLLLLAVCVGVVLAHVLVIGLDRPINWDEAIHVSQVNPARPAVFMEPHRTRGLSLLVAPIAVFDPSMVVLRLFVLAVGAAGLFAAFRTWIPVVGWAAPVAAALYATHWVTIFYFVEVLPNHPSALLAVAAGGLVARAVAMPDPATVPAGAPPAGAAVARPTPPRGGGRTSRPAPPALGLQLAALFALFAMVRPPDGLIVGVALGVALLLWRGVAALGPVAWAAAGGVVGLLPWFAEGWVRFGLGPVETVRSAGEYGVDADATNLLPVYLESLETRLRCADSCMARFAELEAAWPLPPAPTMAFLVVAAGLTLLALIAGGRRARQALTGPLLAGGGLVAFYGLGGGVMNLRYLIPAFALLLVPVAVGGWIVFGPLLSRWSRARADLARLGVVLALLVTSLWQLQLAREQFAEPATRDRAADVGQALATVADGDDCTVVTGINYPQIQYWSGCLAVTASDQDGQLQPPLGELGSYVDVSARARSGSRVFAVDAAPPAEASPLLRDWEVVTPGGEPVRGRHLYEHVEGAALPPPPCPPDGDGGRILAERLSSDC